MKNHRPFDLKTAIARLELVDARRDVMAGSRAVEVHVGQAALAAAREAHGAAMIADVDLSVSAREYAHLRQSPQLGPVERRHRYPRLQRAGYYSVRSLSLNNGMYDVWRERWFEPARYPEGIVSMDELLHNSEWRDDLGINVLNRDYLAAQRYRSIQFLESAGSLTEAQGQRLAKDKADLDSLNN